VPKSNNLFALISGPFDKDNPTQEYFDLKLALLKKGIPSQFVNYQNIRKSGVFNYHLPNIAIGIHAKLGGIPWRIQAEHKSMLIVGFNQVKTRNEQFTGSSVFFDNMGHLKQTNAYGERESRNQILQLLKDAIQGYLDEHSELERVVIHYHKILSGKERNQIEQLLKSELKLSIPYAVVEVNDTKSRLEIAFDPEYSNGMPVSGSVLKLSKKNYLLFNNNRFKVVAPVGVKDEWPLKLRIHFADESGFSHQELIDQVYEFSRLIWKGLKQQSQPATCFYAKEMAKFRSNISEDVPNNHLTQTTPWVI
jgi:hypothetical protein